MVSNGEKPSFVIEQEKNRMKAMMEMERWIESSLFDKIESPNDYAMLKLILMRLIARTASNKSKNSISNYPSPFLLG